MGNARRQDPAQLPLFAGVQHAGHPHRRWRALSVHQGAPATGGGGAGHGSVLRLRRRLLSAAQVLHAARAAQGVRRRRVGSPRQLPAGPQLLLAADGVGRPQKQPSAMGQPSGHMEEPAAATDRSTCAGNAGGGCAGVDEWRLYAAYVRSFWQGSEQAAQKRFLSVCMQFAVLHSGLLDELKQLEGEGKCAAHQAHIGRDVRPVLDNQQERYVQTRQPRRGDGGMQ